MAEMNTYYFEGEDKSWVSSAYRWKETPYFGARGSEYIENNTGQGSNLAEHHN